MAYLGIANKWLRIPGRAFRSYLDQTIVSYLGTADRATQAQRLERFVEAISAAARSSYPLVSIDRPLFDATHGDEGYGLEVNAICSGIPISVGGAGFAPVRNSLLSAGFASDSIDEWFIGEGEGGALKSVEIFCQLSRPVGPVPLGSLLLPVLDEWNRVCRDPKSRRDFMAMRRARLLPEALPAHPDQWRAMLCGWFVARLLGLLNSETQAGEETSVGPRLSVWVDQSRGFADFPFPLYSAVPPKTIQDYPGVVLESLMIAVAQCHGTTNLIPLAAYHRLLALGGAEEHWSDLHGWILTGKAMVGAPTPREDRAGNSEMSIEERRSACLSTLEEFRDEFEEFIGELNPHVDSRTYPVTWEIREHVIWAISRVMESCTQVRKIEIL
jgi:hypothetical protein